MRAVVDLAGLKPTDVRVEAVIGRVGSTGQLEDTEVLTLPAVEQRGRRLSSRGVRTAANRPFRVQLCGSVRTTTITL